MPTTHTHRGTAANTGEHTTEARHSLSKTRPCSTAGKHHSEAEATGTTPSGLRARMAQKRSHPAHTLSQTPTRATKSAPPHIPADRPPIRRPYNNSPRRGCVCVCLVVLARSAFCCRSGSLSPCSFRNVALFGVRINYLSWFILQRPSDPAYTELVH